MTNSPVWLTGGNLADFPAWGNIASILPHQLVHRAYQIFISQFLLVWLLFLVLIVSWGLLFSGHGSPIFPSISEQAASDRRPRLFGRVRPADVISSIAFLLFVVLYMFLILYKEDFAYYDDEMLTDFSIQGVNLSPPIMLSIGRFFPLADQEFNLFRFVTRSPAGYHSLIVVQLAIVLVVLFVILRKIQIRYRTLVLIAAMLAPSFLIPFSGFVYPERNVLFWLAIMVLCIQGYFRTKARIYFIGCLVATHFALYYKETAVLCVAAFAITQLLLWFCIGRRRGHRSWSELARENCLSVGILGVCAIYVVVFLAAMLPHGNSSYITEHQQAMSSVLLAYLQTDWLPLVLITVVVVRFGRFIFCGVPLDPIWDSLGVGALAYLFAIIGLRLVSGYYMAPADLIALLYLASMSLAWLSRPTRTRVSVVAIIFACVLLQDAAYSSFRIVERKSVITTKTKLADFLNGYLETAGDRPVELFFPFASGYHLMELSSYLKYKGFQLVGQSNSIRETRPRLLIEGRENFANNRCVDYRDYVCMHVDTPGAGTLIVVLPDDIASLDDVEKIGKDSTLLLSLKPPGICTKKWFRSLHAISPEFSVGQLPEHWLQLDVFKNTAASVSGFRRPPFPWTGGLDVPALWAR
jgi:hypothetical protein